MWPPPLCTIKPVVWGHALSFVVVVAYVCMLKLAGLRTVATETFSIINLIFRGGYYVYQDSWDAAIGEHSDLVRESLGTARIPLPWQW